MNTIQVFVYFYLTLQGIFMDTLLPIPGIFLYIGVLWEIGVVSSMISLPVKVLVTGKWTPSNTLKYKTKTVWFYFERGKSKLAPRAFFSQRRGHLSKQYGI